MFDNPRRGRQARNFTTNVPKILDLKSSSEQIFPENCRWVPLLHGSQAHTHEPTVTQLTVGNVPAKYARLMFAEKSFCPPLTESYI